MGKDSIMESEIERLKKEQRRRHNRSLAIIVLLLLVVFVLVVVPVTQQAIFAPHFQYIICHK